MIFELTGLANFRKPCFCVLKYCNFFNLSVYLKSVKVMNVDRELTGELNHIIENKLQNFKKAQKRLSEAVGIYKSSPDDKLYRDGLIQRFEFTFELGWKTAAAYLQSHGVVLDMLSPKTVLKAAYAAGLIDNEAVWVKLLGDRNVTSHMYDELEADKIADEICMHYSREMSTLYKKLSGKE